MKPVFPTLAVGVVAFALILGFTGAASGFAKPADVVVPAKGRQPVTTATGLRNPLFSASEILGRPTANTVTVNVVPAVAMDLYYEYGRVPETYTAQTAVQNAAAEGPLETVIDQLQPNTRYFYRLRYRPVGMADFAAGEEHTFITQRAPGSTFTFALQGDSHPERLNQQFNPELYTRTLHTVADDQPDFYLTIGDDFSVDNLAEITAATVQQLYRNQRQFLGLVGHSAPLFLVNGNHEQAALVNLNGTPNNVAVWAQTARNAYYSQPAPDGFYTGDAQLVDFVGLLRDYYAWRWGDALFVVIDPYWHSAVAVDNALGSNDKTRDMWGITLGEAQYQWFKQTLEGSTAKYKFVFAHHVNGTGRGGIELADLYEWGGHDGKGAWQFDTQRPGWAAPLHQLMAQNGVTIFFQGHDHIFVRQERDGVIYQTLPEPAHPFYTYENDAAYKSGDKLPNSGYVRVTVAPEGVTVAYRRAFRTQDENATQIHGAVAYSYTVTAPPVVATFPGSVVLGSPTDTAITANILADAALSAYLAYGPQSVGMISQTAALSLSAGSPTTVVIAGLTPDTPYIYQLRFQEAGAVAFARGATYSFHTQRRAGQPFTFTIDADPHNRDSSFDGALYTQTLQNALSAAPDFHINLGDNFMTEKVQAQNYAEVVQTMVDLRPYFALVGQTAPLYLLNGNHEGELGWLRNGTPDNLAIWSTQARQRYYPNPTPRAFYSGSTTTEPIIGVRDGYYAWEWGDALFVVLDPFWYTTSKPRPGGDGWGWTLGKAQYDWFKKTLAASHAPFKFVFAHHLVGGSSDEYGIARGGIELAHLYEWGGYNLDGSWGFDDQRPGWGEPLHQLLVKHHVTIFFHGHDHLFVKQELDGVIYQEVPQPSHRSYDNSSTASAYGYVNGVIQGNSGHLRVNMAPNAVTVDYVRAYLPQDENAQRKNGAISHQYTILATPAPVYLPLVRQD